MSRTPLVAGNWKMFRTTREARELMPRLVEAAAPVSDGVDVAVCPPFLAIEAALEAAHDAGIDVYAQNMHEAVEGAYTGEVSAGMLSDVGVDGVLLGHSERRQYFCESDRALAQKVVAALEAGLKPMLCVGETEDERERGDTERRLRAQVQEGLNGLRDDRLAEVVIAYEPVWAIGTGKVATPEQAQEAVAFIRALVGDRDKEAAQRVRVLYGGSVKPDNAPELLALPDVDGALVGGACLDPDSFAAIIAAARR